MSYGSKGKTPMKKSTPIAAEYVLYTIVVTDLAGLVTTSSASRMFKTRQIPESYQRITHGADIFDGDEKVGEHPSTISVPRLPTFWRGQEQEDAWQKGIKEAIKDLGAECTITVAPWSPAPGYPKGSF
jgi:hypothetical protein